MDFTKDELDALFAALEIACLECTKHPETEKYWEVWPEIKDRLEELP